jgi:hypothetical protein
MPITPPISQSRHVAASVLNEISRPTIEFPLTILGGNQRSSKLFPGWENVTSPRD